MEKLNTTAIEWTIFSLLVLHFLLSSFSWITHTTPLADKNVKKTFITTEKIYFLSVVIIGFSLLFVSLQIFDKTIF